MNRPVNQLSDSQGSATKPAAVKRTSDALPGNNTPHEMRSRLLKMIKENEQKRHKEVSSPLIQR
jgi:hypothetical protein